VFYTVFERMLGNGRQEKKKYAAVYDNIITYNKLPPPSAELGRLTAQEVAEPSCWQLLWKVSHNFISFSFVRELRPRLPPAKHDKMMGSLYGIAAW